MLLFAQRLDVVYHLTLKPNANDSTYIEEDQFSLQIQDNNSVFYSNLFQYVMRNQAKAKEENLDINKISSNYIITKEEDNIYHHVQYFDGYIKYEEPEPLHWTIVKGQKEIGGYRCDKAVTNFRGRDYVAYFTRDISINDGPYKFKGLPGLVLEVFSRDGDYHFTLVSIEKSDKNISTPQAKLLKNRSEYLDLLKKFAENPSYIAIQKDQSNKFEYKTYIEGREVNKNEKYRQLNDFVWKFMKIHNNPIEKDDIWIR